MEELQANENKMFECDDLDISTSVPCKKMAIYNFRPVLNDICRARSRSCEAGLQFLFHKYRAPTPCGFCYLQAILKRISQIPVNQQKQMLLLQAISLEVSFSAVLI